MSDRSSQSVSFSKSSGSDITNSINTTCPVADVKGGKESDPNTQAEGARHYQQPRSEFIQREGMHPISSNSAGCSRPETSLFSSWDDLVQRHRQDMWADIPLVRRWIDSQP